MANDHALCWVHTVPCTQCQGRHTEYISRPSCKGCESLLEHLKPAKTAKSKRPKETPIMVYGHNNGEKAWMLKQQGKSLKEIAAELNITVSTVLAHLLRYKYKHGIKVGRNAKSVET